MARDRGRRWGMLAIVAALLLAPIGDDAPARAQDVALQEKLEGIARETAEIRELPPLDQLDDVILSRDELERMMPELIAEESDPAELARESRALAALGLIPEGTDLLDLTIRLMNEQAAGFYDPVTDEMYVIADGDFGAEAYFYAHEVVHALQDAWLDPNDRLEETTSDNSDETLARLALYEGDAVSAANDYLAAHPDLALALVREANADFPVLAGAPAAVSATLVFPYFSGERFVTRLLGEEGWDAVDAAYADLPASTEQILHPQKYLQRDRPVSVPLPEPSALGVGWQLVSDDTLGELQTALLLANLGPGRGFNTLTGQLDLPEAARNAAAGWDGDRFALWEDAAGKREILVWRSAWDTPRDARAFSRALAQFGETRWGGVFNGESPDDVALVTGEVAARILLDGQEVLYVQAPDLPLADQALAALQAAPPPDPAPSPG